MRQVMLAMILTLIFWWLSRVWLANVMKWCGSAACSVLFEFQSMSLLFQKRNSMNGRTWLEPFFIGPTQKENFSMKHPVDLARRFLALADRDIKTLHLLTAVSDSDDQAIGFHAQQAIEKCLKAVL